MSLRLTGPRSAAKLLVTTLNRGMRAASNAMRRRGAGYVVALTTVVTLGLT